ncbi:MAG: hypothetical protein S4CHLAM20_00250 [Chlamydiia bacterium]|nr:hypothetical protein [Chlamydiia bacterium]
MQDIKDGIVSRREREFQEVDLNAGIKCLQEITIEFTGLLNKQTTLKKIKPSSPHSAERQSTLEKTSLVSRAFMSLSDLAGTVRKKFFSGGGGGGGGGLVESDSAFSTSASTSASRDAARDAWETENKIRNFMFRGGCVLGEALDCGFLFSQIDNAITNDLLRKAINSETSFLVNYIEQCDLALLTDQNLTERFASNMLTLSGDTLAEICCTLLNKGKKAEYLLLFIIINRAKLSVTMPSFQDFCATNIKDILSSGIIDQSITTSAPHEFISLFLFGGRLGGTSLFLYILNDKSRKMFLTFVLDRCIYYPQFTLKQKKYVILTLLQCVDPESKIICAQNLCKSADKETESIGMAILGGLSAESLNGAIPHLNALNAIFGLDYHDSMRLFGHPFIKLSEVEPARKGFYLSQIEEIRWTRNHEITDKSGVRIRTFNTGMNGRCLSSTLTGRKTPYVRRKTPYVLGYGKDGEWLWGIPYENADEKGPTYGKPEILIRETSSSLVVQFLNENLVRIVDPLTGALEQMFSLPYPYLDESDEIYVTDDGLAYQLVYTRKGEKLACVSIAGKESAPSFDVLLQHNRGEFYKLGTHVGFLVNDKLNLYNSTGNKVVIECKSVSEKAGVLYLEELDPKSKSYRSTTRRLKSGNDVVSEARSTT